VTYVAACIDLIAIIIYGRYIVEYLNLLPVSGKAKQCNMERFQNANRIKTEVVKHKPSLFVSMTL
jgi:hypothetical protein